MLPFESTALNAAQETSPHPTEEIATGGLFRAQTLGPRTGMRAPWASVVGREGRFAGVFPKTKGHAFARRAN